MGRSIFPPYLQKGDRVIIISPSSQIKPELIEGAKEFLEKRGLEVKVAEHAFNGYASFAGTAEDRAADLQNALDDDKARAILCSRGGYGAVHLLNRVNLEKFRQQPKWLIGFSDITILHNMLQAEGYASLHAPMARHIVAEGPEDEATSKTMEILFGKGNAAEGKEMRYTAAPHRYNHRGTAAGIIKGGNLAVSNGLRGTKFDFVPDGSILYIEEVGEDPYKIERMFYNLKLSGMLERLNGLIIGQFTEYEENFELGKEVYGAVADLLKEYTFPIAFNFPVGHTKRNLPIINGAEVVLEVNEEQTSLIIKM